MSAISHIRIDLSNSNLYNEKGIRKWKSRIYKEIIWIKTQKIQRQDRPDGNGPKNRQSLLILLVCTSSRCCFGISSAYIWAVRRAGRLVMTNS